VVEHEGLGLSLKSEGVVVSVGVKVIVLACWAWLQTVVGWMESAACRSA
jgi:hypothetical protein